MWHFASSKIRSNRKRHRQTGIIKLALASVLSGKLHYKIKCRLKRLLVALKTKGDFMKKKTNGTELLLIIPAFGLLAIWVLYIIFEK